MKLYIRSSNRTTKLRVHKDYIEETPRDLKVGYERDGGAPAIGTVNFPKSIITVSLRSPYYHLNVPTDFLNDHLPYGCYIIQN